MHDVVIAGHDREFVTALIFPNIETRRTLGTGAYQERLCALLDSFAEMFPGSSTMIRRASILETPPAIDVLELTEKGSVNQKAVLCNRAAVVDALYAITPPDTVFVIGERRETGGAKRRD